MIEAPRIDKRTAADIAGQVYRLLPEYVSQWPERGKEGELANALIHVFARFNELIIERLNQAPNKNFLAFLDLLGISPMSLQVARVPLTFYLAAGNAGPVVVPMRTQVGAPPPPGQQNPIIFETEEDLTVVSTLLASLIIKDGARDRYVDLTAILNPPAPAGTPVAGAGLISPSSRGDVVPILHVFYISLPTFAVWPAISETRLKFTLEADVPSPADPRLLRWEQCAPEEGKAPAVLAPNLIAGQPLGQETFSAVALEPQVDDTGNLTRSGDVVFLNLPDTKEPVIIDGISAKWLRCRLVTPIDSSPASSAGTVGVSQLPTIKALTIENKVERTGLPVEQAFFNAIKLDTSKDFFPFGEKPKFGDTLYLASREAFSSPGASLTINVSVTNPASSNVDTPIPAAKPQDTKLSWEFWDGKEWWELGNAAFGVIRVGGEFQDKTKVFSENGTVTFKFPKAPMLLNIGGQKNYWIRVRIVGGDYGKEAHYEQHPVRGLVLVPATFAPPSIRSISVDFSVVRDFQPDAILTYNDFVYARKDPQLGAFQPFVPVPADQSSPTLYFGFVPPPIARKTRFLPQSPMNLYVGVVQAAVEQNTPATGTSATATWEFWNGAAWKRTTVLDDTHGFRRAGLIRFLSPADFALSEQFRQSCYWLRMRPKKPQFRPEVRHVLLNTTMAVQGATITNEVLGASNEMPGQHFRTTQTPVLAGQRVEIREPIEPSAAERAQIQAAEGADAIAAVKEPITREPSFWVRWHEVPNFYGSGPRDRHYLLERMTGEITFGDGSNGMIPPALPGNVRSTYRAGGGTAGNQAANTITQLKTAIPYIQKAANLEAASGGSDAEAESALLVRGPRTVRHGGRAVTREDFEDLALRTSHEVARARCVPLFDLAQDPDARRKKTGTVSLIILPRSTETRPRLSQDLVDQVWTFIDSCRGPAAKLILVGPEYVRVDVKCEITVTALEKASEVETAVKRALDRYLHPVNGGPNGMGWDFGREPQRSDLFALLETIPGLSHVRELRVSLIPDRPGSEKTDRFLVCCGTYQVTITLEE